MCVIFGEIGEILNSAQVYDRCWTVLCSQTVTSSVSEWWLPDL